MTAQTLTSAPARLIAARNAVLVALDCNKQWTNPRSYSDKLFLQHFPPSYLRGAIPSLIDRDVFPANEPESWELLLEQIELLKSQQAQAVANAKAARTTAAKAIADKSNQVGYARHCKKNDNRKRHERKAVESTCRRKKHQNHWQG